MENIFLTFRRNVWSKFLHDIIIEALEHARLITCIPITQGRKRKKDLYKYIYVRLSDCAKKSFTKIFHECIAFD